MATAFRRRTTDSARATTVVTPRSGMTETTTPSASDRASFPGVTPWRSCCFTGATTRRWSASFTRDISLNITRRGRRDPASRGGPRRTLAQTPDLGYIGAAMISVQDVTKAFGPKKLFEDVNVTFAPGRRFGLTGPNGAGKSTFMKILSGDEEADTGRVHRPKRLGILRQDHFKYESDRVIDVVLMGNQVLWKAMKEKDDI